MATIKEIGDAITIISTTKQSHRQFTLLHCNSNYPAKPSLCDMSRIKTLRDIFIKDVGWSDHTCDPGIIYHAVANDASIIEFHLDLEDGLGYESEHGHCWKPSKIQEVIKNVDSWKQSEKKVDISEFYELRSQRTNPTDGKRPLKNA